MAKKQQMQLDVVTAAGPCLLIRGFKGLGVPLNPEPRHIGQELWVYKAQVWVAFFSYS